jgi:putative SOS response-associated peptidase YedK
MCGRYASTSSRANLLEQFHVDDDNAAELKGPDFNVAPTKVAPVVIARAPLDGPKDADPVRQLRLFKWGLLPAQLHRPGPENLSAGRTCPGRYHRAG